MRARVLAISSALLVATACTGGEPPERDASPAPVTATATSPPAPEVPLPRSMAALGDSITRGFLLCEGFGDCPTASWSTGTAAEVDSHRQRIARLRGHPIAAHNLAVSGAQVAGLQQQAARAVQLRVEYVTVLVGANDACAASERDMTPVREFAAAFERAVATLARGLPRARVLVLSVPDLLRLWQVGRPRAEVRATWDRYSICPSLLAQPAATSGPAMARRVRVRDRVIAYNAGMAGACARHPRCRWDEGAVFSHRFSLDLVSRRDWWHPSGTGQQTLADVSWHAGFWARA